MEGEILASPLPIAFYFRQFCGFHPIWELGIHPILEIFALFSAGSAEMPPFRVA
jgi:hypothetical protein